MEITYELAQPIVEKIKMTLNYNINIMNHEGIIVASSDPNRINSLHNGAVEVVNSKKGKIIQPSEAKNLEGTKPGANLPIYMHGRCVGVVGITGDPDKVYPIANIVKLTTEALINQKYLIDKLRYERESIREWLLDLMKSSNTEVDELINRAKLLGIDTQKKCSIILIKVVELDSPQTPFNEKMEMADHVTNSLSMNIRSHFLSHIGNGLFLLGFPVTKSNSKNESIAVSALIEKQLFQRNLTCAIGVGNAYDSISGYQKSYFEAKHSLHLIELNKGDQNVMHILDWGIIRLLDKVPNDIKDSFVNQYLGDKPPITDEWMETLHLFLEYDQDIDKTAKALLIHRNTLVYRLEKIKSIWGLDPRTFSDAIILKCFLIFK